MIHQTICALSRTEHGYWTDRQRSGYSLCRHKSRSKPKPQMPTVTTAILSGNEAIALGAAHAGVRVARAYPGTPSTEILEALSHFEGVDAQWATNEKTAVEIATGASYAGARAFAAMKHVGLNVAADPFFAVSMTGVRGGLVIVSADDPSMHSSQNEQDNRQYARFAKVPLLEPADSQECYELTRLAYDLSERYDTPVMLRTTTRVSHSKSVVRYDATTRERPSPLPRFRRDPGKLVMIPANARRRRPLVEVRMTSLAEVAETFPYNRIIPGSTDIGIIADGAAYQYAREVFPDASFLKLTLTFPFPVGAHSEHSPNRWTGCWCARSLDPFIEEAVRSLGISVEGKSVFPAIGEFSPDVIALSGFNAGLCSGPASTTAAGPRRTRVRRHCRLARLCSVQVAHIPPPSTRYAVSVTNRGPSHRATRSRGASLGHSAAPDRSSVGISAVTRSASCRRCLPWIPPAAWAPASVMPSAWRKRACPRRQSLSLATPLSCTLASRHCWTLCTTAGPRRQSSWTTTQPR